MALALAFWYAESEKGISGVKARTTTAADEHNAANSSRNLMVDYGVQVRCDWLLLMGR